VVRSPAARGGNRWQPRHVPGRRAPGPSRRSGPRRAHPAAAKRRIGVVSQSNTLDRSRTVCENLYYHGRFFGVSRRGARQRADELLEQFALQERADAMVFELLGGLAQRLMVARALAHRPQVLFLDEPTSGLDPQTRHNLWRILGDLHRDGLTILLTTDYRRRRMPSANGSRSSTTAGCSPSAAPLSSSGCTAPTP
jgi:energy-coupling factor transporter ATP-binding protein EcfA2